MFTIYHLNKSIMSKDRLVFQSNQPVLSKINLSNIYEKKLLYTFVNSLSPHLEGQIEKSKGIHLSEKTGLELNKYKTKTYEYRLSDIEPSGNYRRLRAAITKLRETSINVVFEDGREYFTGLISSAELYESDDSFSVQLSVPAYQFLLNMTKGYTIKSFLTSLDMNTIYSSCIYELLCKWRNNKTFEIDIDELIFITNAPKSYKPADVKRRILDTAKKELDLSDFTDLKFNYETIKIGKRIKRFKINIIRTGKDVLEQTKLTKNTSQDG